jgi:hypothetical protein
MRPKPLKKSFLANKNNESINISKPSLIELEKN